MTTPQGKGYYPGYDLLEQAGHWDEVTRELVLGRVDRVPPIRFFSPAEATTLGAFCDLVLAQDREPRVPVLAMVDAKLYEGRLDGFRYDDMPDDRETWRLVARGLDASAFPSGAKGAAGAQGFADASEPVQRGTVQGFCDGTLRGGVWDQLPPKKAWSVVMRGVLGAFYSHPWAWNEIGFGGPAYPRGYARLAAGQREHWQRPEQRESDQA